MYFLSISLVLHAHVTYIVATENYSIYTRHITHFFQNVTCVGFRVNMSPAMTYAVVIYLALPEVLVMQWLPWTAQPFGQTAAIICRLKTNSTVIGRL